MQLTHRTGQIESSALSSRRGQAAAPPLRGLRVPNKLLKLANRLRLSRISLPFPYPPVCGKAYRRQKYFYRLIELFLTMNTKVL